MARLSQRNGEMEVAARFANAAHEHVDRVAAQLAGLERHARVTAERAVDGAGRARHELQRQTAYAVERAGGLLRERPMIGAALALAAGIFVLAALTRRNR